jgi:hypothetical protein
MDDLPIATATEYTMGTKPMNSAKQIFLSRLYRR